MKPIKKDNCTLLKIPEELWDEKSKILSKWKLSKTVGRPITPFRKVMDGIVYVLRTGCQRKMLSSEYGSGSTCHSWFQQWVELDIFKKIWARLLQPYDNKQVVKWTWQSLDSISIKSPLGGAIT